MTYDGRVRVVFVAGAGRSGSTLLDRVLGQAPGACSIGELRHIWRLGFIANDFCGCGANFRDCPFWREVVSEAFGGFERVDAHLLGRTQENLLRARSAPALAWPRLLGERQRTARDAWAAAYLRLYRSIARVAGATSVIDSSKNPMYGLLLASIPEIELRVIHLVRDSRAVAYSWADRVKPHPLKGGRPTFELTKHWHAAAWWDIANGFTEVAWPLRRRPYFRVRYEDLVCEFGPWVDRLAHHAGLESPRQGADGGATVDVGVQHTVAGNPMRFDQGRVTVRDDDEWRTGLSPRNRRVVTAWTLPLLAKYGYLGRR